MTKLLSTLPNGQNNGLDSIASQLVNEPAKTHICIVVLDCKKVETDTDSGDVIPHARIRRIEPINEDRNKVAMLLRRALEERTGETLLPFDTEEEMEGIFSGLDPKTGEIRRDQPFEDEGE
jgi:hypothetical protein